MFSDLFFFFFDFFGDIFLVVSLGFNLAWPWPVLLLVVLLWLSIFFILIISGISEGRDNILGRTFCRDNPWGPWPVGRGLAHLSTTLLGPVILIYLQKSLVHRIRCKEWEFKSFKISHFGEDQELNQREDQELDPREDQELNQRELQEISQREDQELSQREDQELSQREDQELNLKNNQKLNQLYDLNCELVSLVERRRQLACMLARTHQMHVVIEEVLQLFCQLLIVYLTATTFRYPSVVGWFSKGQSLLFVLYMSITWSKKLASSFLLKQQDTVSLLGTLLIYLRTFLEVGTCLTTLALYLVHSSAMQQQQLCDSNDLASSFDGQARPISWGPGICFLLTIIIAHVVLITMLKLLFPTEKPDTTRHIYRSLCHAVNSLVVSTPLRSRKTELAAMSQPQLEQEWGSLRLEYVGMEVRVEGFEKNAPHSVFCLIVVGPELQNFRSQCCLLPWSQGLRKFGLLCKNQHFYIFIFYFQACDRGERILTKKLKMQRNKKKYLFKHAFVEFFSNFIFVLYIVH